MKGNGRRGNNWNIERKRKEDKKFKRYSKRDKNKNINKKKYRDVMWSYLFLIEAYFYEEIHTTPHNHIMKFCKSLLPFSSPLHLILLLLIFLLLSSLSCSTSYPVFSITPPILIFIQFLSFLLIFTHVTIFTHVFIFPYLGAILGGVHQEAQGCLCTGWYSESNCW